MFIDIIRQYKQHNTLSDMVQTFLLFDTIAIQKTVKFMQRDIITSTITWNLGLAGSNNFGGEFWLLDRHTKELSNAFGLNFL